MVSGLVVDLLGSQTGLQGFNRVSDWTDQGSDCRYCSPVKRLERKRTECARLNAVLNAAYAIPRALTVIAT